MSKIEKSEQGNDQILVEQRGHAMDENALQVSKYEEEGFAANGGYVITQPCITAKDASCMDACPVDCIHPRPDEPEFDTVKMLYINPNECTCCGACEPACPVNAIFEASAVPKEWRRYIKINADFFKS